MEVSMCLEEEEEDKKISFFSFSVQVQEVTRQNHIHLVGWPGENWFFFRSYVISLHENWGTQPPTVACKMEAKLKYIHIAYTCFARFAPFCLLSRCLLTKFLHRSSVRTLLSVRCWLGERKKRKETKAGSNNRRKEKENPGKIALILSLSLFSFSYYHHMAPA